MRSGAPSGMSSSSGVLCSEWLDGHPSGWFVVCLSNAMGPSDMWTPCFMIFDPSWAYLLCVSPTLAPESVVILQNEFVKDTIWPE